MKITIRKYYSPFEYEIHNDKKEWKYIVALLLLGVGLIIAITM